MRTFARFSMLFCVLALSACANVSPVLHDENLHDDRSSAAQSVVVPQRKNLLSRMLARVWPKKTNVVNGLQPVDRPKITLPLDKTGPTMRKQRMSLSATIKSFQTPSADVNASGIYALADGVEAFAARNALIKNAERSLDLQYYSLHKGLSSRLLIRELVRAADRGVKIRILIDDTDTLGRDKEMILLSAHENIKVKIFNPIRRFRGTMLSRALMFATHIKSMQRRMHNKVWLADGVLAVVGGRNIGDKYFNANAEDNFSDLDALLGGEVVGRIQTSFDEYWHSPNAVAVETFVQEPLTESAHEIQQMIIKTNALTRKERVAHHPYLTALNEAENHILPNLMPKMSWGQIDFYSDSPNKVTTPLAHDRITVASSGEKMNSGSSVLDALMPYIINAQHEVIIVNPYFLPGEEMAQVLSDLVKRGVAVTLLTNSLEANDVPLVNGPYSRYRLKLLKAGVKVFELRGFPEVGKTAQWRLPIFSWQGSRAALHSKAVVVDGKTSFIGSMNLDPRSILWNTEVGVIAQQPIFAKHLREVLLGATALRYSYAVELDSSRRLVWRTTAENLNQSADEADVGSSVLTRERGNFLRRLQKSLGASIPERYL